MSEDRGYYSDRAIDNIQTVYLQVLAEAGESNPATLIDIFNQAKLAPDPDALPLSTAMRMARERTRAGNETWVEGALPEHVWDDWIVLRLNDEGWEHISRKGSRTDVWYAEDPLPQEWVEYAKCRLVTPEEGERLLRGEA